MSGPDHGLDHLMPRIKYEIVNRMKRASKEGRKIRKPDLLSNADGPKKRLDVVIRRSAY
jgi:hypothetical protein